MKRLDFKIMFFHVPLENSTTNVLEEFHKCGPAEAEPFGTKTIFIVTGLTTWILQDATCHLSEYNTIQLTNGKRGKIHLFDF